MLLRGGEGAEVMRDSEDKRKWTYGQGKGGKGEGGCEDKGGGEGEGEGEGCRKAARDRHPSKDMELTIEERERQGIRDQIAQS